jgi:PleD family two-component response regulator
LGQESYDIVILDVMLPGVSGFEICRRVRRSSELYRIPVMFLSAMASDEEVMHGLSQGGDDYITKPFSMSNLIQHVEALLRAAADSGNVDALTSLPGADQTKRELQRRTITNDNFALGYAELTGLREFAYRYGPDARMKAIRHFARALDKIGTELKSSGFYVGHMGGGHFVSIMPPDKVDTYCSAVTKFWDKHFGELCAAVGKKSGLKPNEGGSEAQDGVPLEVLICVTNHSPQTPITPQSMFETLSHIRQKAQDTHKGGVHVDRRM